MSQTIIANHSNIIYNYTNLLQISQLFNIADKIQVNIL